MAKPRVFTAFDFDHDEDLRNLLVGQSRNSDSPFEMADWSVKEPMSGDWKEKVRRRIKSVDQIIVLCGSQTHLATGVATELAITQEEGRPYFLLKGRATQTCRPPTTARPGDKIYNWTWENLKLLVGGAR